MKTRRLPLFVASFLLGIAFSTAAHAAVKVNITCIEYKLDLRDETDIKDAVNFIYQFFDGIYHFTEDLPIEIKLYGKYDAYFSDARKLTSLIPDGGFFTPLTRQILINAERPKLEALSILYHEATHAIFHKEITDHLPFWINEGIAEYFQGLEVTSDRRVVIRPVPKRLDLIRAKLDAGALPPLKDYLQFSEREWFIRGNFGDQEARAVGWSLVYFLTSEHEGTLVLEDFLKALNKTSESTSGMIRVLEQSYRAPLEKLEADWHEFLRTEPPEHDYPLPSRQIAVHQS